MISSLQDRLDQARKAFEEAFIPTITINPKFAIEDSTKNLGFKVNLLDKKILFTKPYFQTKEFSMFSYSTSTQKYKHPKGILLWIQIAKDLNFTFPVSEIVARGEEDGFWNNLIKESINSGLSEKAPLLTEEIKNSEIKIGKIDSGQFDILFCLKPDSIFRSEEDEEKPFVLIYTFYVSSLTPEHKNLYDKYLAIVEEQSRVGKIADKKAAIKSQESYLVRLNEELKSLCK